MSDLGPYREPRDLALLSPIRARILPPASLRMRGAIMIRRMLRKLFVSLATLTVLFVIGELWTRSLEPGPFSLFDRNPYRKHERGEGFERHKPNFEGRWDGTWYKTNSLGLRGEEVAEPAENQLRIVCLGDSCTFGKGVKESESWPRQLEHFLQEMAQGAWDPVVANLGVNGYHGASYELILEEVGQALEPDIILVGFNLNDFPNAISMVDNKVLRERTSRRIIPQNVRDAFGRFSLYRWARQTFYHLRRKQDWANAETFAAGVAAGAADDPVWERQRQVLRGIHNKSKECGAQMAMFLFPYESQIFLTTYDRTPIERLHGLCSEIGIPFLDLAEPFREKAKASEGEMQLFLRGDRYHPTGTGYQVVAQEVVERIKENGWLSKLVKKTVSKEPEKE